MALAAAPFPNKLNRDDPRFPSEFRQVGGHSAFLVRAESVLASGPSAVWEALVEMQSNDGAPYVVREIHQGAPRTLDLLRRMQGAANALPPC